MQGTGPTNRNRIRGGCPIRILHNTFDLGFGGTEVDDARQEGLLKVAKSR
jgi:hypothetical protein